MKKIVTFVMGLSKAGKDTTLDIINKSDNATVSVKFIELLKEHLEFLYDLPKGSLNTAETKAKIIEGTTNTYLDLLIAYYHFVLKNDPLMFIRPTIKKVRALLDGDSDVHLVFTDIRYQAEVEALTELMLKYENNVKFNLLYLIRDEVKPTSSDNNLDSNIKTLVNKVNGQVHIIYNDGTLADLNDMVTDYLKDIYD